MIVHNQRQQQQQQQVIGLGGQVQQPPPPPNMHPQQQQQQQQQQQLDHYGPPGDQQQYLANSSSSNTSADHPNMYQTQQQQQHLVGEQPMFQQRAQQQLPMAGQRRLGQPAMSNHNRLAAGYQAPEQRYATLPKSQLAPQTVSPQVPHHPQPSYQQSQQAAGNGYEQQAGQQFGGQLVAPEPAAHQRGLVGGPHQMRPQPPVPVPAPLHLRAAGHANQVQHQIPVRSVPVAGRAIGQQHQLQYKRDLQQSAGPAHLAHQFSQQQQQQHGNYNNGAANYNGGGPFADQVEQYPSSSPTLLQQQLNRHSGAPPPLPPPPQQQQQQQHHRLVGDGYAPAKLARQPAGRYEQAYLAEQVAPMRQSPSDGSRPMGGAEQQVYYPASGGSQPRGPPVQVQVQMQMQTQVRPRQQAAPENQGSLLHHQQQTQHHHQHHHQPPAHLLGNPTPPLTPVAAGPAAPVRPPVMGGVQQVLAPDSHQWQHGPLNDLHAQQASAFSGPGNNQMQSKQHHLQQAGELGLAAPLNGQHRMVSSKIANSNNNFQYQANSNQAPSNQLQHHHSQHHHHHNVPTSHRVPLKSSPPNAQQQQLQHHQQIDMPSRGQAIPEMAPSQTRLTLPLSGAPLMGPFKLDHDAQFTSRVFHLKSRLFETLSKSMQLINPQAATVVQELQFRAYLIKPSGLPGAPHQQGDSLLASNSQPANSKVCNWPELFQLSINQNVIHLDRSKNGPHRAVDIFQYCQVGENVLEIQVNDCYCTHEFVMEAVDRPTLKAFMNSCFKSRQLPTERCIQKMRLHFGLPGFLIQSQHLQQTSNIVNEYVTEFVQGVEQTRTRISLRCPISGRRMRTPTRGHNCKHLQCFDLENFLYTNRERSQWNCPICSLSIPFNMLELDQHQMNIVQEMSDIHNTDDVLMDSAGQWQTYHGPSPILHQQQPLPPMRPATTGPQNAPVPHLIPQPQQQQFPAIQTTHTAKSSGTYHPQAPTSQDDIPAHLQQQQQHLNQAQPVHHRQQPIQNQPMRPMSGPGMSGRGGALGSPAPWDSPMHPHEGASPHLLRGPPGQVSAGQPGGRRSANGSPLTKKPYAGQYAQADMAQPVPIGSSPPTFFNGNHDPVGEGSLAAGGVDSQVAATDDLSPLAAMELTIIQHEQQMGPPPFDPNSLTSSSPAALRGNSTGSGSLISSPASSSQLAQQKMVPGGHQVTQQQQQQLIQTSPARASFSPAPLGVSSPASGRSMVAASPQQRSASRGGASAGQQQQQQQSAGEPPQSPMQQQQSQQAPSTSISTPATPSSSMLVLGGPETPATPSNSGGQHCGPSSVSALGQSPHLGATGMGVGQQQSGVDQQPLSNGSASAGSMTSSSTMTTSGQSLGSVGMGGDSRCGTAPLQANGPLGLDDLMLPGGSLHAGPGGSSQFKQALHGNSHIIDEKNEILMGKLMMDSNESILRDHRNGDLAIALEECDWKQQLDRGKSEHLANFLNEPLMKRHQSHHYHHQQHQQQQQAALSKGMISGGLNPSDDEGANQSHSSSPSHNLDQLEFANYLDADAADNGAGLPPDDSILDLFER